MTRNDAVVGREQRLVFGEVAEAYQAARPSYPDGLYAAIAEIAGLQGGERVLEIGAGTGKATEGFVARGYDVSAIEPSPQMAAVLAQRFPGLTIAECGFEDWPLEPHGFSVIAAAQSWHWVDVDVALPKAAAALQDGGWLMLFWNRHDIEDCEWHEELQPIYHRITEPLTHENIRHTQLNTHRDNQAKLLGSGHFGELVVRHVPWVERYTTAEYVALLGTYSDHRMLPDEQRAALHGAIAESIDARGGEVEHPYVTDLIAAPVLPR